MPERWYVEFNFLIHTGKKLNLKHPVTYREKLQWLKLYDRNPQYTVMADKCKAKQYVASIIGEEYILPLLQKFDRVSAIDIDKLPEQFVLKCNHDSGSIIIFQNGHTRILNVAYLLSLICMTITQGYTTISFTVLMENLNSCILMA